MNTTYPRIYLKPKKETPILRFHPWVFSGAIKRKADDLEDGAIVEVRSAGGSFLALGHYHDGNIAVRIFSFEPVEVDAAFWSEKLAYAFELRKQLDLVSNASTNAYRLVHGEGDGLPGLIIDVYGNVAIIQAHSIGMHLQRNALAEALKLVYGDRLHAVYDKSKKTLPATYAQTMEDGYLWENKENLSNSILENGHTFDINWVEGQKTGFFLDQRYNRHLLATYAPDKTILNTFCYSGGFSIYALKSGAKRVDSVDISAKATDQLEKNIILNGLGSNPHNTYTEDVLTFLKRTEDLYDIVILDPPAYAKSLKKRHKAVQGYKRLNIAGLKRVKKGGLLFTFSCSQVVDAPLFYNTITAAAIEAKRSVRVIHQLTQPGDHPINMYHPEGSYLKGLVIRVD